jgi:hypothetical protein
MFQLPEIIKVIKLLFAEPTQEEDTEREWKDARDIASYPAFYPNFDAKRVCSIIKDDYPDVWYQHSIELIKMAKEAEEDYNLI